jgi:hypothetical protein
MGELSAAERRAAVPAFLRKVYKWRPRIVCMVGKGIWEDVFNYAVKASKGQGTADGIQVEETAPGGPSLGKLRASFEYDIQPVCLLHGTDKGKQKLEELSRIIYSDNRSRQNSVLCRAKYLWTSVNSSGQ